MNVAKRWEMNRVVWWKRLHFYTLCLQTLCQCSVFPGLCHRSRAQKFSRSVSFLSTIFMLVLQNLFSSNSIIFHSWVWELAPLQLMR